MAIFDTGWVEAANGILAGHQTGAVPEFSVAVQIVFDEAEYDDCWLMASGGGQQFAKSYSPPSDVVARVPYAVAATAFDNDDQTVFMNSLLGSGSLWLEGDFAKAQFFMAGLIRNASPEIIQALRGLP
jgi:hypothetical protein